MNESNRGSNDEAARSEQSESNSANGSELELLRQRVRELEKEKAKCQESMAALQAERDHWYEESIEWAKKEFLRTGPLTEAEWKRLIEEEDWQPLDAAFWNDLKKDAGEA